MKRFPYVGNHFNRSLFLHKICRNPDCFFCSMEYLEPGCQITEEEETGFLAEFPEMIKDSAVVTTSGSMPQGMSGDIYRNMILLAKEAGKQVILDTSGEALKPQTGCGTSE